MPPLQLTCPELPLKSGELCGKTRHTFFRSAHDRSHKFTVVRLCTRVRLILQLLYRNLVSVILVDLVRGHKLATLGARWYYNTGSEAAIAAARASPAVCRSSGMTRRRAKHTRLCGHWTRRRCAHASQCLLSLCPSHRHSIIAGITIGMERGRQRINRTGMF